MFSRVIFTSQGESSSLALVGHYFSDGVFLKICSKCFTASTSLVPHSYLVSWLKPNLACYVRLREMSVVVVDVNVYPFFVSSDLTCQREEIEIGAFWLHCAT